jgi:uncharacterized membrane protein
MKSLKSLLSQYVDEGVYAGENELGTDQLAAIEAHLRRLRVRNKNIVIGCVIAMAILFALVLFWSGDQKKLELLIGRSSIVGISIAGIATYSYKVWKEVNYVDLLLIFVKTMDRSALQTIINETWKKL